jgi:MoaA/NifB/PqqE/SkfB family radical SAM enzyme
MNEITPPTGKKDKEAPRIHIRRFRIFDIEVSRRCNLACEFCPRTALKKQGIMTPETFDSFLQHTGLRFGDMVLFCGLGEPLLNPSLPGFIARVKERGPKAKTQIITNGTLLNAEKVAMLLDAPMDFIIISVNGIDAETYEKVMKGASFSQAMSTIDHIQEEIQKRQPIPTQLMVTYVLSSENLHEEENINAFWQSKGIMTVPQYMHNRGGFVEVEGMSPVRAEGPLTRPCLFFEPYTFVAFNGDVPLCCNDIEHQHLLGNIHTDSMELIETHKRQYLEEKNWPGLCTTCTAPPHAGAPI